jgi:hypothetical protein
MTGSSASLDPVAQQAVVPGSIVRTDDWNGYNRLKALGYIHEVVRKSADVGDNLLPCCNRAAALLKRWLMGIIREQSAMIILTITSTNIRSGSTAHISLPRQTVLPAYSAGGGYWPSAILRSHKEHGGVKAQNTKYRAWLS